MGRKSKDAIIRELQSAYSLNEMYITQLSSRQNQLIDTIDDAYKNSSHYYLQKERLELITKLYDLSNSLCDAQRQQNARLKSRLRSALQQLKQQDIDENSCCDFRLSELQDQIHLLEGKVENRDETIQILNDIILDYQNKVADLQMSLNIQPPSNDIKELRDLLLCQSSITEQYRNQTEELLFLYTTLLTQLSELLKQPAIIGGPLHDTIRKALEHTHIPDSSRSALSPSTCTVETQKLKDRITALEAELKSLRAEKKRYGRPPKISPDDVTKILSLIQEGISYRRISEIYGYSLGTISRIYQSHKTNHSLEG